MHSYLHDDAADARVIVQVPVGVQVNGISASSTDGSISSANCTTMSSGNTDGHVMCRLGNMQVGEEATVLVRTTPPPADVTRRACSAFAWSRVPDPDLADNHAVSP